MEIKKLPGNVILTKLSSDDPKISEDLRKLNEYISLKEDCDVVVDFSQVEIINSSNISNLLILRGFLDKHGRKLFLYNVKTITRSIFVIAGLTETFNFIDETQDIMKAVQPVS